MNKIKLMLNFIMYLILVVSNFQIANTQNSCDESMDFKTVFINSSQVWDIPDCKLNQTQIGMPMFMSNDLINLTWIMSGIRHYNYYSNGYILYMEAIQSDSDKNTIIAKVNFKVQILDSDVDIRDVSDANYIPINSSIKFRIGKLDYEDCNMYYLKIRVDLNVLVKVKTINWRNHECFKSLGHFVGNKKFSDVTLTIKNKTMYAHKIILSSRSPVFDKLLESNLQKKNFNIDIDVDVDHTTINEALRYMYTGKVQNIDDINSNLLIVANKYKISGLKEICEIRACNNMDLFDSISMLNLAIVNDAYELKNCSMWYITENLSVLANTADFKSLMVNNSELTAEIITAALSKK